MVTTIRNTKKPLMGPGAFLVINYTETASVSMGEGETPGHHMTPLLSGELGSVIHSKGLVVTGALHLSDGSFHPCLHNSSAGLRNVGYRVQFINVECTFCIRHF